MTPTQGENFPRIKDSERACIDALSSGLTQQQAAAELGVHIRTLEENLRAVRERWGVQTTYQLVAIATHFELLGPMWLSTIAKYPQKSNYPPKPRS